MATAAAGSGVDATAHGSGRNSHLFGRLVVLVEVRAEARQLAGVLADSPPLAAMGILIPHGLEFGFVAT